MKINKVHAIFINSGTIIMNHWFVVIPLYFIIKDINKIAKIAIEGLGAEELGYKLGFLKFLSLFSWDLVFPIQIPF